MTLIIRPSRLIIPLLFLLIEACQQTPKIANTETQQEALMEAIHQFNTAFKEGDLTVLTRMITDNYQHTNGNNKSVGKESWLSYLKKRKGEIDQGLLVVNEYKMEEVEIELFCDMAILTAKISVSSKREEILQENEYRVTNIWVKENDGWKRAAFHDGKIK